VIFFVANFQHFGKDNILSQTLFVKIKSPKNKKYIKKLQEIATIAYNMKRCLRFFLPFIF
jgi:hypothetical protein